LLRVGGCEELKMTAKGHEISFGRDKMIHCIKELINTTVII
jgi:hypothetical protein